jgi:hypothetical protein
LVLYARLFYFIGSNEMLNCGAERLSLNWIPAADDPIIDLTPQQQQHGSVWTNFVGKYSSGAVRSNYYRNTAAAAAAGCSRCTSTIKTKMKKKKCSRVPSKATD